MKVTVTLGQKYNGEEVCNCGRERRRPIDRGLRCYVPSKKRDYSEPDKVRVLACDSCNGAILHRSRLQILDI